MLFRKSAQQFTEEYYRGVSNAQLQELHGTFKAYVPDDYQQVCSYAEVALCCLSAFYKPKLKVFLANCLVAASFQWRIPKAILALVSAFVTALTVL